MKLEMPPPRHGKTMRLLIAKARFDALMEAAAVARNYGPSRPLLGRSTDPIFKGRWEGEQAASGGIAHLLEKLARETKL